MAKAVSATFANRDTAIDVSPIAFTPDFTDQPSTLAQWAHRKELEEALRGALRKRTQIEEELRECVRREREARADAES